MKEKDIMNKLQERAEEIIENSRLRDWCGEYVKEFRKSISAALRQTREETLKEALSEREEWRLGFEQGKKEGLEEAAKVAENQAIAGIAGACARDEIVEKIRALASGSEHK